MRLVPWDPDLRTLVERIKLGEIDLQPEFQRGEVWSEKKKQLLIDSIIREWHIPPIHVVEHENGARLQVLDGQQRLAAIRDFFSDSFALRGDSEPKNERIQRLAGARCSQLPPEVRRAFERYTVHVLKITDFQEGEPGELFFRLNQPTHLTAAEQRNAFLGPVRTQVSELSALFTADSRLIDRIGFSNLRMAIDDVVARFCIHIEQKTLRVKLSAADLAGRYRSGPAFSADTIGRALKAIRTTTAAIFSVPDSPRMNKATLFSWLIAFDQFERKLGNTQFSIRAFSRYVELHHPELLGIEEVPEKELERLLTLRSVFEDRAATRVLDTSSVVIRDFVIWTIASSIWPTRSSPDRSTEPLGRIRTDLATLPPGAIDIEAWLAQRTLTWGGLV